MANIKSKSAIVMMAGSPVTAVRTLATKQFNWRGLGKKLLVHLLNSRPGDRVLTFLEQQVGKQPNTVRILTYHRVEDQDAFAQHARYLEVNYHVISMQELLAAYNGDCPLPARAILITFDDAYRNFAKCAWPILQRYRLPVTLFVPTAFPDQPERTFWWDQLEQAFTHTSRRDALDTPAGKFALGTAAQRRHAFRQMREFVKQFPHQETLDQVDEVYRQLGAPPAEHEVLGWDELRRLAAAGVTLGAHTQTHPLLNCISPQQAVAEAIGSLRDLEREIERVLPIFAYPGGRFNDEVVRLVQEAGFALAFTTERGTNNLRHTDPLRLRRINIGWHASLPVLRAWLLHAALINTVESPLSTIRFINYFWR